MVKRVLVQMRLGDYGYHEWMTADCLRPIRHEYLKTPWFAQKCHLVDIGPPSGGGWSQGTCEALLSLVSGKKCFMNQKVVLLLHFFAA